MNSAVDAFAMMSSMIALGTSFWAMRRASIRGPSPLVQVIRVQKELAESFRRSVRMQKLALKLIPPIFQIDQRPKD